MEQQLGESIMDNHMGMLILIAVLVQKLGGTVTVSQEDFDGVAYMRLDEKQAHSKLTLQLVQASAPRTLL